MRILACGRTLAAMLSPLVSSLSVVRNHRPLRSATRPWGLPALKLSDKCQVTKDNLCVSSLVCEWPEHASVEGFLLVSLTLWARVCGNAVDRKIRSTSAFWKFTTVLLDHTGEEPLVMISEDSLTDRAAFDYFVTFLIICSFFCRPRTRITTFIA